MLLTSFSGKASILTVTVLIFMLPFYEKQNPGLRRRPKVDQCIVFDAVCNDSKVLHAQKPRTITLDELKSNFK